MSSDPRPKLRALERFTLPTPDGGFLVLRDPLGVAPMQKIEKDLEPVLDALDGTKTVSQIRQSLSMVHGLVLDPADFDAFVTQLERDGLLEGPGFLALRAAAVEQFEREDVRAPRAAGVLFPDDPEELAALMGRCLPAPHDRVDADRSTRALLTPHHDFEAAAEVLEPCIRDLPSPDAIDVIVLLGTDHASGMRPFAITDKDYATPLGTVTTDYELADRIFTALPETQIEQLRHRDAHSLEFPAVMLRHLYQDRCPRVLPVLCGRAGFQGRDAPAARAALVEAITASVDPARIVWWASAELSHVGPAYGHPDGDTSERLRAMARRQDQRCVHHLVAGRRVELDRLLERSPLELRPSGAAAIELLLDALGPEAGAAEARYAAAEVMPQHGPSVTGWAGLVGARFSWT